MRARSASLLLILLIAVSFFTAIFVANQFGLSRAEPSSRMRLHALPVAISQVYHGRKHDYTARRVTDAPGASEPDEYSACDEDPAERFERALLAVF